MHEHWKDCQDYPEAHKWVGKDPEYDEEEQVRALVWSQETDEEDYIGEGEALRIAQLTIPASANVASKTDYKTKDIGKYEDAALMPSMMGLSTPTTSMNMPRTEQARVVSRAPRKSTSVSEAELFNQHWKQIKDDFILEEKFTKWNLRRLRRSLELWQEAVEEEVRQKIAAEAVLKLSSDGPHTPSRNSPTPDEEAERPWGWQFNYDESDEEEPDKAIEYEEGPDSDDEDEPGEAEEQYTEEDPDEEETITADDADMYPLGSYILKRSAGRGKMSKAQQWQKKKKKRKKTTDMMRPGWGDAHRTSEGSNPWQQQVEAAKQSLAQYHQTAAPAPAAVLPVLQYGIDMRKTFQIHKFSWIPVQEEGAQESPLQEKESVPLWTSEYVFIVERKDTFAPFVPTRSSRAVVRVRSHAKKSRRVRFSAQEKVKIFKREAPLQMTVLVERLRGRSPEREVMSRSDIVSPSDNVKTRRCMHEHWKDCQDYPEAHKWVGKDPEYDEEEQVRALVWSQETDEEDYIGEGEALRIAQLVSGMLVHAEPSSAGTSTAGRMKIT
ncbi:hypothetical protein EI94DRAFT_1819520 [Lactarius quietus]|nr:hypothetical protein EI94DRAFT_1819520 [Lactarius quietus]